MNEYPCIICQNGDPYSNIICSDCEEHQEWLKELNQMMEQLVFINNDLFGHVPMDISNNVRDEVNKIWDQLYNLKIEGKERCH
jgi:hypothetical protein